MTLANKSESAWVDFGSDHDKAREDAKKLSSALGKPVVLHFHKLSYYCAPLVKLLKVEDLNKEFPGHEIINSR